jgi:putative transposase
MQMRQGIPAVRPIPHVFRNRLVDRAKRAAFFESQRRRGGKQAEAGISIKDLCRKGGFSDATFYKWRSKFGGMGVSDARRRRDLEGENAKLKRFLAEAHLDIAALKGVFGVNR